MSVAVLITTHGHAAEPLRKTAEMIIGEQENLVCLEFVPGENGEVLAQKMRDALNTLDTANGVLFLVDLWGGTPFNAASKVSSEIERADVVTGVNIPMLVETLMARDDTDDLKELVNTALQSGAEGVKALNTQATPTVSTQKTAESKPIVSQNSSNENFDENDPEIIKLREEESKQVKDGPHMALGLLRIDDRLIHGQVATRWTKETEVNRIIVVNDDVAKDKMRTTMLKQAVPNGVTAHTVSIDKMIRVFNNPEYANDRVMLLFTNATDVLRLFERGMPIKSVNIGGMAYKEGRTMLDMSVSVNDDDVKAFEKLNEAGVELEVRKVSNDNKVNIMNLLKDKYYRKN
ncbi:PTS mannose transporter subunit IIAB [Suttonella ornithocola]|uniref:PTS system mannose-specific EIIAB component n=1 Tax=Suttonella ornithocola TaxID=279832 RepID=A0A380MU84_9GAMM|nr:PTS mannose transporter subunit IIAB [Suttonella ornithocola]SUO95606.1 EIIAB-Man [Suttonella ornithocola]